MASAQDPQGPTGVGRTFDADGAAEYLGVNPATIRRWASTGELKGGYRDMLHKGGPWRFSKQVLDEFREARHRQVSID